MPSVRRRSTTKSSKTTKTKSSKSSKPIKRNSSVARKSLKQRNKKFEQQARLAMTTLKLEALLEQYFKQVLVNVYEDGEIISPRRISNIVKQYVEEVLDLDKAHHFVIDKEDDYFNIIYDYTNFYQTYLPKLEPLKERMYDEMIGTLENKGLYTPETEAEVNNMILDFMNRIGSKPIAESIVYLLNNFTSSIPNWRASQIREYIADETDFLSFVQDLAED